MMPVRTTRCVLALLTLLTLPAAALAQDDYEWKPRFDASHELVYKECSLLQRQVADRERERREAHQRCLDDAARRSSRGGYCEDDRFTGCTCRDCAPFHGPDEYMQQQLEGCMQRARQAADRARQEEQRRAELERATRAFGDAVNRTLQDGRQATTPAPKTSPPAARSLPAPEYDPLRPGTRPPPTYRPPAIEAPAGRSGAAPAPATAGERLAATMPDFDDLTRAGAVAAGAPSPGDLLARSGGAALDSGVLPNLGVERAVVDSIDAARTLVGGVERLQSWVDFARNLSSGSGEAILDRGQFVTQEWNSYRSGPSAFATQRSLDTIFAVSRDVSGRLDRAFAAFDSAAAGSAWDYGRDTDFSTLHTTIGMSMCGRPCAILVTGHATVRSSWDALMRQVQGRQW